eukprot:CAMPEP_0118642866 /NCGR_PEP_ID=MMETSP0785-20121206/6065_1 /TAXON_ID=91992 /ORGANISM="Bolidomonas pacifica, Strain CCMP 1866" /LENGTH=397 /DNA_ID=CAMNT_0006534449 /DNA_START=32 /DNA_END=1221 /DNA_ORIENTATION=+
MPRRSSIVSTDGAPNPRAQRVEKLIALSDQNLSKILTYSTYLPSKVSTSCRSFLGQNLSRFGDSHDAAEMITWARNNATLVSTELDFEETLQSKYSSFLCSSLLLILMECYFIPSSSEMASLLGMTARWWRSKIETLKNIPPTTAEVWRTKNEARLRAIDKVREQFNGKEAPSTLESLLGSSYKPQEVDGTVFRPRIGGSPEKPRTRARSHGRIRELKGMTGIYDWSKDDMVKNYVPTPSKTYTNKDLDKSIRLRAEHEQEERDELFFGDFGVFKESSKDQVSNIVTQLFKSQSTMDLAAQKAGNISNGEAGDAGGEADALSEKEVTTPREVVDSKELLTKKFSTVEHVKTLSWEQSTSRELERSLSQHAIDRSPTKLDSAASSIAKLFSAKSKAEL